MSLFTTSHTTFDRSWRSAITTSWAFVLVLLLVSCAHADPGNDTSPTHQFKSRPDLHAPIIDIKINRPELVVPGYIMMAPYRNIDPGPYIYDNQGQLVWSGAGSSGPKTAHAPRVCQFRGTDHLCYFQGEQHQGFARGHGVIMDKNYRVVKTVESSGAGASADMHEFKMTPYSNGTTVLMTVYQPRQFDMSVNPRFNVENGMGWIVEGVFQEIEIETGRVVFEWRSLDHIEPGLSWTMPGSTDTSGDGLHEQSPWDYFHINSIDKNREGDFLISARHVSAIYKLSGEDGHIMWQMGGNAATIETLDFVFSYQHHARWLSENATHTILSFYDNASNTYNSTGKVSHGWIIAIDHMTETAWKIQEWGGPDGGILSGSQGNLQLLPGGGAHIGWGEHAYFSEHTADGEIVLYGQVAQRASNVMIYRSNKYNWTAQPLTKPAVWSFSRNGNEKTAAWASWNGATEVRYWRFLGSNKAIGPWTTLGTVSRTGFETEFHHHDHYLFIHAEALDTNKNVLERSVVGRTFTPSPLLVNSCDDRGCNKPTRPEKEKLTPYEAVIITSAEYLSINRGFDTTNYYALSPSFAARVGGVALTLVLSAIGLLAGIALAAVAFAMYIRQRVHPREPWSDRLSAASMRVADGISRTTFGSKVLGRYTRVHSGEKESDYGSRRFSGGSRRIEAHVVEPDSSELS